MARRKTVTAAKRAPKAAPRPISKPASQRVPKPDRLDAPAWIDAAFDTLAEHGIDAVRVEPLAKALAVTKGSFYWHFADRRALVDAMLEQWTQARIEAIRAQAAGADSPTMILLRLADLYTRHGNVRGLAIELAIRAFARNDDGAARAVRAVDSERLKDVTVLFEQLGWPPGDAKARAVLFYSYLFGQSHHLLDRAFELPDDGCRHQRA